MAYNQDNSVTYNSLEQSRINTGFTSVLSASANTSYAPSKGFFVAGGNIYVTASDGTTTYIPVSTNATVVYNLSITRWSNEADDAHVTLLY